MNPSTNDRRESTVNGQTFNQERLAQTESSPRRRTTRGSAHSVARSHERRGGEGADETETKRSGQTKPVRRRSGREKARQLRSNGERRARMRASRLERRHKSRYQ